MLAVLPAFHALNGGDPLATGAGKLVSEALVIAWRLASGWMDMRQALPPAPGAEEPVDGEGSEGEEEPEEVEEEEPEEAEEEEVSALVPGAAAAGGGCGGAQRWSRACVGLTAAAGTFVRRKTMTTGMTRAGRAVSAAAPATTTAR